VEPEIQQSRPKSPDYFRAMEIPLVRWLIPFTGGQRASLTCAIISSHGAAPGRTKTPWEAGEARDVSAPGLEAGIGHIVGIVRQDSVVSNRAPSLAPLLRCPCSYMALARATRADRRALTVAVLHAGDGGRQISGLCLGFKPWNRLCRIRYRGRRFRVPLGLSFCHDCHFLWGGVGVFICGAAAVAFTAYVLYCQPATHCLASVGPGRKTWGILQLVCDTDYATMVGIRAKEQS